MDILSEVAEAMQSVLSTKADIIAYESDFIKRERKLNGSNFVQTLVFGWLANPSSSLEDLFQFLFGSEIETKITDSDSRCLGSVNLPSGIRPEIHERSGFVSTSGLG